MKYRVNRQRFSGRGDVHPTSDGTLLNSNLKIICMQYLLSWNLREEVFVERASSSCMEP